MWTGVLDRWVLRSYGKEARELGYCREIHQETRRQFDRRAVTALMTFHTLCSYHRFLDSSTATPYIGPKSIHGGLQLHPPLLSAVAVTDVRHSSR